MANEKAAKEHKCSFTALAPESCEDDAANWEWCIRCGKLRLGNLTFVPGAHQKKVIVAEEERE